MTMLLLSAVMARVKPVAGKMNWFAIDAVPKLLGYSDIGEWLHDEMSGDHSEIVEGAKLMGVHNHGAVLEEDPRFNYQANVAGEDPEFGNEPEFVILRQRKKLPHRPEDLYLCAMMVNAPEAGFFEYFVKAVYGAKFEWQGKYDEWLTMPEQHAEHFAKAEEAEEAAFQQMLRKLEKTDPARAKLMKELHEE